MGANNVTAMIERRSFLETFFIGSVFALSLSKPASTYAVSLAKLTLTRAVPQAAFRKDLGNKLFCTMNRSALSPSVDMILFGDQRLDRTSRTGHLIGGHIHHVAARLQPGARNTTGVDNARHHQEKRKSHARKKKSIRDLCLECCLNEITGGSS
jgi:hypothetical protein